MEGCGVLCFDVTGMTAGPRGATCDGTIIVGGVGTTAVGGGGAVVAGGVGTAGSCAAAGR